VAAPTLAEIAADLEARARALWDEGKREAAWEVMGEAFGLMKGIASALALTDAPNSRTLPDGMAQSLIELRRPGRPTKSRHPFPVALEARRKTVAEWARDHRLEREVVKAWFAPGTAGRRIPLQWAKTIQKELGVPATEDVWRNGIRA
jgi:hypothetical protein